MKPIFILLLLAYPYGTGVFGQKVNNENIGQTVANYLMITLENLKDARFTSLRHLHTIESPGGTHLTYIQLYGSVPVYCSEIKVNLNKENHIKSIFKSPTQLVSASLNEREPVPSANNFPGESIASAYLNNVRNLKSYVLENIYYVNEEQLIPAVKLEISAADHDYYEVIIDYTGNVLYQKDLNRYFLKFVQDSIVTVSIFLPDPLTTAGVTYGSPYIDSDDSDVPELNAERVTVNITVDFTNDTFRLISPYAKIMELSSPSTPETYSTSPSFNYTRSQDGFEDVNACYHINFFQQYIQSLGFLNLANYQIDVDAHALNGDDQSVFSGGDILFGEGGVDDAEDADVIIHEYGHAILESAAPGTWSGFERQSLEEGFGDYLATSYSRYLNPFNWQNMFSWDGHNPFWEGRTTASTKLYPTDLGFDIHLAGEIWSSALMQIWGDIGRTTTDRILLQSLYSYAAGMTMTDAANLFLQADSLLNGGANYIQSYYRFMKRGFFPDTTVGIDKPYQVGSISIFPNPTSGKFKVTFDAKAIKASSIRIYNSIGQIVNADGIIESGEMEKSYVFDISNQPNGFYILSIQTPYETINLKLIKVR